VKPGVEWVAKSIITSALLLENPGVELVAKSIITSAHLLVKPGVEWIAKSIITSAHLLVKPGVEWVAKSICKWIPAAKKCPKQVEWIHGMETEVPRVDVGWRCSAATAIAATTPQPLLAVSVVHLALVLVTEDNNIRLCLYSV
jgi:hypothetical protein